MRVGACDAMREQNTIEYRGGGLDLTFDVHVRQPRVSLCLARDGHRVDHCYPCGRHLRRLTIHLRTADPGSLGRSLWRAERVQHDHTLRISALFRAHQVATVGRTEIPRKLHLHEEEQLPWHRRSVFSLISLRRTRGASDVRW